MGNILKRRLHDATPSERYRHVIPNYVVPMDTPPAEHPNHQYVSNRIKTTKYTVFSFVPKNLFEQLHRFANLYFIFIVLLNWVPQVNAFGKEVAMIPVIFVLAVTAIKDAFEDYRRYKSDKTVNNLPCRVYCRQEKRYIRKIWADIRVGDIIHLSCNEVIPADLVLLWSSDKQGVCYIDTSNMDGENNLKQRQVVHGVNQQDQEFHPPLFTHTLQCEHPNMDINKFRGAMLTQLGERLPISKNNVLLRGCIVRNTDFVDGIVVYSGHETKAFLNNRGPRSKRSKIERSINRDVIWCVIILFLMCFLCAFGSGSWISRYSHLENILFIPYESLSELSPAYQGFIRFWTYIIIFQVMIPLSLYVTIELVKLSQAYFIHQDIHLYDPQSNRKVQCRALNITEDLGQIQYIFSDKTGTLTENCMQFKRCTIGGVNFCKSDPEEEDQLTRRTSETNSAYPMELASKPDPTLQKVLSGMTLSSTPLYVPMPVQRIWDFFLLMTVCNTVVVSKEHVDKMDAAGIWHEDVDEDKENAVSSNDKIVGQLKHKRYHRLADDTATTTQNKKKKSKVRKSIIKSPHSPSKKKTHSVLENEESDDESAVTDQSALSYQSLQMRYEAESPDELALVKAACYYGCRLLQRTSEYLCVQLPGGCEVSIKVLHILPFDAVRKKMSIIIEHPFTKEIVLYCKGADSSVLTNVQCPERSKDQGEEPDIFQLTRDHLTDFAKQGLRTLCLATKVISSKEYEHWLSQHELADSSIENRERLLYDAACQIETNMVLLGATGIEDHLQEGVPETIASLREAEIKVWVVTGDKQETALNIAYSCNLISFEQELIVLNASTKQRAEELITNHLEFMNREEAPPGLAVPYSINSQKKVPKRDAALVIDGRTLAFALDKGLERDFLDLAQQCSSVLCCRATPSQKAAVVRLVRDKLKKLTLAIGDGANDVSMIQTADIGVGISGQEGMQAVMASDFALPRFRFLKRMLLVHGHWCYDNLGRMTLYMFYKNAVFIFMLLWFQIYCGFSGGTMLDDLNLITFNLIYTSFPPIIYGIFDKDLPDRILMTNPKLYTQGPKDQVYRRHSYFICILDAVWQSLVEFFVPYLTYRNSSVGIWEFGITANAGCVFATLLHLCIETRLWTVFHWLVQLLSFFLFFGFYLVLDTICVTCSPPANPYAVAKTTFATPEFWLSVLLTVVIALTPRFLIRVMQGSFYPSLTVISRNNIISSGNPIPERYYASWSSASSSNSVRFARREEHTTSTDA